MCAIQMLLCKSHILHFYFLGYLFMVVKRDPDAIKNRLCTVLCSYLNVNKDALS